MTVFATVGVASFTLVGQVGASMLIGACVQQLCSVLSACTCWQ